MNRSWKCKNRKLVVVVVVVVIVVVVVVVFVVIVVMLVGFQVLTAMAIIMPWDVTMCSQLEKLPTNSVCSFLPDCLSLSISSALKTSMFLRNVSELLQDYTASHSRR